MDPFNTLSTAIYHVAAVPVPGRSHINPMLSLCKILASKTQSILITFVVTEEWLGLLASDHAATNPELPNLRFASIPNVVPSELLLRDADILGFYEAAMTKMEAPFEKLLHQLDPPVTAIITDMELFWAIRFGNSRNIPVATLITTSAKFFSRIHYIGQIQDQNLMFELLEQSGEEKVDISTGISSREIRTIYGGSGKRGVELSLFSYSWLPKSQYLLLNSVYEIEQEVLDTLKPKYSCPIYPIGPAVPYLDLQQNSSVTSSAITTKAPNYLKWLDSQPEGSVLYVSLGSFHSVSSQQMEELAAGLQSSGVKCLWVARGESSNCVEKGYGLVVPWCNQLKVLCHASIGGFLTHCGWNSTLEALFAGVPMLTFPIMYDQVLNEKQIVQDLEIGWKVGARVARDDSLVSREEISEILKKFMDEQSTDVQNLRQRARRFREILEEARANGGSSERNLDAFIKDILQTKFQSIDDVYVMKT